MLELDYWSFLKKQKPELLQVTYFNFSQPYPRLGWYSIEELDGYSWAWSGPGTISNIEIPLDRSTDLEIEFKVRFVAEIDILNSLQLIIDGDPVFIAKTEYAGGVLFRGVLHKPQKQTNIPGHFSFVVNRTTYPPGVLLSSRDARLLGFALEWIRISPIE
jgi:hypothetical protein